MIPNRLLCFSLRRSSIFLAAGLTMVAVGCGSDNGLNLAKVSGRVTYKGQPVTNGTVFFMPDESKGTVGPAAVGSLTSTGDFVMSTESAGDGVIVGHHLVGVTGVELIEDSDEPEIDPTQDAARYMKAKAQQAAATTRPRRRIPVGDRGVFIDKGGKKFRYVVPAKFVKPEQSGIVVNVDRSRTVNIDIDASDLPRVSP